MSASYDVHVTSDPDQRGWNVAHAGRRLSHHRTQKKAVAIGRRLSRLLRVDLVTHGRDGRVRSKDSYGNESAVQDTEQ
jgi:hypothetical protein